MQALPIFPFTEQKRALAQIQKMRNDDETVTQFRLVCWVSLTRYFINSEKHLLIFFPDAIEECR